MAPEGEPYPFDIMISDGEWVQVFDTVTYIATAVPETATYTFTYTWNSNGILYKSIGRAFLSFKGIKEFEFYAHDIEQIELRAKPYIAFQEIGAIDSISWNWDPDNLILTWIVSRWSDKCCGTMVAIDSLELQYPDYGIVTWDFADPDATDVCKYIYTWWEENPRKYHLSQHDVMSTSTRSEPYLVQDTVSAQFRVISVDSGVIDIGYPFYNGAVIAKTFTHTLWTIEGIQSPSNFFDPRYVVPPGNYIWQIHDIPEHYVPLQLPLEISMGKLVSFESFPPRIVDLEPFTFLIAAQPFFWQKSFIFQFIPRNK